MTPHYYINPRSANRKTGPIATTLAPACPASCPLAGAGCYGENFLLALHVKRLKAGAMGQPWAAHLRALRALDVPTLRLHVYGDLPATPQGRLDVKRARALLRAASARGRTAFTYSHWRAPSTLRALTHETGTTVNASANSPRDLDALRALDPSVPLVTLLTSPAKRQTSPGGQP